MSVKSALHRVLCLLRRGVALFDECQKLISPEHGDRVRELTSALRQWLHSHVPGELYFGTLLLIEQVGQRDQPAMLLVRDFLRPVLYHQRGTGHLYVDRHAFTI